ncbi:DUF1223 domain-containing protein [Methylobacterium sp. Leaf118]|uniref:DUF1223 domain-containing protein n=1 Tax=Methylobacterium sp. Leaf118 TaxID=2876562 RepID=UPI001E4157CE|nr:DUF1223 domain-containing protein [Methylobacterium sp. Leaf118]
MRRAWAVVTAVPIALALPHAPACGADPESAPVRTVVEMFTSQGCSACLTADRLTGEFSRDPGVLALTLPVTHWDYLGWKDTLAERAFDERQRGYAGQHRLRQVATPQAVVGGQETVGGSDGTALSRLLQGAGPLPAQVHVTERNERIVIDIEADPQNRPGEIWLLPIVRSRPVVIGRGENRGRVAIYANVVRGFVRVGTWSGAAVHVEVPRAAARVGGADSYAVLVQAGGPGRPGRILGAAKGPGL